MTHHQNTVTPWWTSIQDANVTPEQDPVTPVEQDDSPVFGMDDYRFIMGDCQVSLWCTHCDDWIEGQGVVNGRLAEVTLTWSSAEQRVSLLDLYEAAKLHHLIHH